MQASQKFFNLANCFTLFQNGFLPFVSKSSTTCLHCHAIPVSWNDASLCCLLFIILSIFVVQFSRCRPASSRTSHPSLPAKAESSFALSLLLSKSNPLRWALIWFEGPRTIALQSIKTRFKHSTPAECLNPSSMVEVIGLEPGTPCLQSRCSTN